MLAYANRNLNDLKLDIVKTNSSTKKYLILDGQRFETTDRFWASVSSRFGLNQKLFKFFSGEEVLQRVMEVSARDRKSIALRLVTDEKSVYGISDPAQKILTYDDVAEVFNKKGIDWSFADGQLQSLVTPDGGHQNFKIGADDHQHRFFLKAPIDGYGNTTASLALLRLVCENGMVAMTPAFTTILKVGKGESKNMSYGLDRALNSFTNDEGFDVLEHRLEVAQKSTASLSELMRIKAVAGKLDATFSPEIVRAIDDASGNVLYNYGVTDLRELGKKAKILPANCTIYDLMNVITEAVTHKFTEKEHAKDANRLNSLIGELLSTEYDLEGTKSKFSEFKDLHFDKVIA